jgi:ABC-type transport system involved in cytochrome c biogenesis ATPase subunit
VLGYGPARRERAFRARIGIVLQEEGLNPAITVREAVELYSAAYPHPLPTHEVIQLLGLADRAGARADKLSGGQRRRLDLALGIAAHARTRAAVLDALEEAGVKAASVTIARPSLDDVYLRYTGRTFDETDRGGDDR